MILPSPLAWVLAQANKVLNPCWPGAVSVPLLWLHPWAHLAVLCPLCLHVLRPRTLPLYPKREASSKIPGVWLFAGPQGIRRDLMCPPLNPRHSPPSGGRHRHLHSSLKQQSPKRLEETSGSTQKCRYKHIVPPPPVWPCALCQPPPPPSVEARSDGSPSTASEQSTEGSRCLTP